MSLPAPLINKPFLFRLIRISVYVFLLITLIFYGVKNNPTITLEMCLLEPEKYDGFYLEIANEITVQQLLPDGFTIHQMGRIIKVIGKTDKVFANNYISLKAVFHKQGWLELVDLHAAPKRRFKIFVSIFPVLWVLFLFFKFFRFRIRSFVFEERI